MRETDLPRFVRSGLTSRLNRVTAILNQFSSVHLDQLVGLRRSPLRIGIQRLARRETVWQDLIDDEILRLTRATNQIREASEATLSDLPERLRQLRIQAQQVANARVIEEILEQPAGRRDPIVWMLRGCQSLRQHDDESAKSAFTKACLRSEGILRAEASRLIADIEINRGDPDLAVQTLRRVEISDPSLRYELLRAAILAGMAQDAAELIRELVPHWPIAILGLFSDPSLLAKAPLWRPALDIAATSLQQDATQEALQWARSMGEAQSCLRQVDRALALPASRIAEVETAVSLSHRPDVFAAHWVVSESRRGLENVAGGARSVLRAWTREKHEAALAIEAKVELLANWRDEQMLQVRTSIVTSEWEPSADFRAPKSMWGAIGLAALVLMIAPPKWALIPLAAAAAFWAFAKQQALREERQRRAEQGEQQEEANRAMMTIQATYERDAAGLAEAAGELRKDMQRADAVMELLNNWPSNFQNAA